jgi:hypothetical protein
MEQTEFNKHLEKRMAAHKRWMHALEAVWTEQIIDDCQALPARAPRQSGELFELLPSYAEETTRAVKVQ